MRQRTSIATDIGEGFGAWRITDDHALLEHVTGANVACGFHAGDPDILRSTCTRAVELGVSIGAHVSYRDLAGFGRRFVDVPRESLINDLLYQISALRVFAELAGGTISYVKAHGALYNSSARHRDHASALVEAVRAYDDSLFLLCQPGTETWELARAAGVRTLAEGFLDRAYTAEGLLVPRGQPGALVADPDEAARRAVRMVTEGKVTSIDGHDVTITPDGGAPAALCVHSDTEGALGLARAAHAALRAHDVALVGVGR